MVKGRYIYIPKELVEELEFTKNNYNIERQADAVRKIVEDLRIGREIRVRLRGRR